MAANLFCRHSSKSPSSMLARDTSRLYTQDQSNAPFGTQGYVKQMEAEVARLRAVPGPVGGSVAQALSLRERLKKLQAAEAAGRGTSRPSTAGSLPEVAALCQRVP